MEESEHNLRIEKIAELILSDRSEEHTSELQSRTNLVCRLLLEKKKQKNIYNKKKKKKSPPHKPTIHT